ncbi:hypothetical protein R3Q06_11125 [Rhodococcus erythropolis]|uniref:hypothetical protein n=1 Tax=Rhodococcus erythropolis TaxID=1833 RepID=UPI0029497986|nr:hypothetical protein [Rhodococcus erythropolis]MDV6274051.1 hypothetical protein [Rhodococcus erythropolis]
MAELERQLDASREAKALLASRRILFDVLFGLKALLGAGLGVWLGVTASYWLMAIPTAGYLIVGFLFFRRARRSYAIRSHERKEP